MRPRFSRPPAPFVAFALVLVASISSPGQDSSSDANSLARYVPKDGVIIYVESAGLDAHAEAWKKTAAYKILNDTTTGVMIEEVAAQFIEKLAARSGAGLPAGRGAESVALLKHVARAGFVLAVVANKDDPNRYSCAFVVRNAFKDKNIRPIMARLLTENNAPNTKPQPVTRVGHKIISTTNTRGLGVSWWVEESKKEDIIQVFPGPEAADVFLETLDGKRPSMIGHLRHVELVKPEGEFLPTGLAFLEPAALKDRRAQTFLGFDDFQKLDFRWGFQGDALMSVARIATSGPRKGLLAFLDGPMFEKAKPPPIPESVKGFTVGSFDLDATLDRLVAMDKTVRPHAEGQYAELVEAIKARTKQRLKEDILAHIGPKMAWYVLPAKAAAKPSTSAPNLFGAMMAGAGIDQLPRLAVVFDVDDSAAFGKMLDEVILAANREFRSRAKPPGEAPAKGGRSRNQGPPAPEFRPVSGEGKTYMLNIPSEIAGQYPPGFRPTIRVGPKQAVIAISPEVAKAAFESKGGWMPPADVEAAFRSLPANLKVLDVADPRETVPGFLAAFPAKVQSTFNTMMLLAGPPPPPGAGPPPNAGSSSPPNPGGARAPVAASGGGSPPASADHGASGTPGASPTGPWTLVLQVDSAKLPSADAIKALMFPSLFWIESGAEEVRISSRVAFPALGDPSRSSALLGLVVPMFRGGPPPSGPVPPPGMVPPPGAPSRPGGPGGVAPGGANAAGRPN